MAWTLQQLVDGIRQGDAHAIGAMVEQFQAPGHRLASALLRDAHLAEDAVQEALIEAIKQIQCLRDPQSFPGWFRQIVRSQCHRITRRAGHGIIEVPSGVAGAEASPAFQAEQDDLRRLVRQALAELPPAGRLTAEMFYMEGFSVAEVAGALDLPIGTVKRRLHDVRRRLRDILIGSAGAMEK